MIHQLGFYVTENTEPCRNLAMEEYLTMHTEEEECILYLWQNRQTVVIGRNQNCWKECRITKLQEDGGQLVRRLSGGGAVFHDLGNLNFTFCVRKENYDVNRQLDVIVEAVRLLGIKAEKTGRNDITVDGRKFSGNAFYDSEGYCYHHGTLLIDVNKEDMSKYLNVSKEKLQSKGVDSVRSRVVNLKELVPSLTIDAMKTALKQAFESVYGGKAKTLPEERLDKEEIERLREKFASWDWIYGKKIPFTQEIGRRFAWGNAELQFEVESGIIRQVNAFSDGMDQEFVAAIPAAFAGCHYDAAELSEALHKIPADKEIQKQMCADIAALIAEQL